MRPGGRWREEGGDRAALAPEIVVVRRVGSRVSRKTRGGSTSRSRHALSPGRVSPAREACWASEWPVPELGPGTARPLAWLSLVHPAFPTPPKVEEVLRPASWLGKLNNIQSFLILRQTWTPIFLSVSCLRDSATSCRRVGS